MITHCKVHHINKEQCIQGSLAAFFLQLQRMSSLQTCAASGRVVQHTSHPSPAFLVQPHSPGSSNHHLSPAMTSLICSPLGVLNKRCLRRWKSINGSTFLGEELLSCLVETFLTACSVIHQDNKSLRLFQPLPNGLHIWINGQCTKCWGDVTVGLPDVPCCFLAPTSKK